MRTRGRIWALAVTVLLAVGTGQASFQVSAPVGNLGVGLWQLHEKGGVVSLVYAPPDKQPKWALSSPNIRTGDGRYLAFDLAGKDPSVRLVAAEGKNTRWTIEVTGTFKPFYKKVDGKRFLVGEEGVRFRLRAQNGPYKGWYLAADPDPAQEKGKPPPSPGAKRMSRAVPTKPRALRLVKDRKDAAEFTYVKVRYHVGSG